MPLVEFLETKLFFNFVRAFAFCVVSLLLVVVAISTSTFLGTYGPFREKVSAEEVFSRLAPFKGSPAGGTASDPDVEASSSVDLPLSVQRYFAESQSRSRLVREMEGLSVEEQRAYIDNLASIIQEAERRNIDVGNSINMFMQLRSQQRPRFSASAAEILSKRVYSGVAALSALVLMALFTLILVLLAIERNTRPRPA